MDRVNRDHVQPQNQQHQHHPKAKNESESAMMTALIQLISLNKGVSKYKERRLKELKLEELLEEDLRIVQALYKEEEKINTARYEINTNMLAQSV